MSKSIHNIILASTCAITFCGAYGGAATQSGDTTTANAVKEIHGSGGHGYAPLDVATTVDEKGHVSQRPTIKVPEGKVPEVVHSGRPDNGTTWGKHIEFRDQTQAEIDKQNTDNLAQAAVVAAEELGKGTLESLEKGDNAEAMLKAAGFGAAVGALIYCLEKILEGLKEN